MSSRYSMHFWHILLTLGHKSHLSHQYGGAVTCKHFFQFIADLIYKFIIAEQGFVVNV